MEKTTKTLLWIGGIAVASYLFWRFNKKRIASEKKSNASGSGKLKAGDLGLDHPENCRNAGGSPDGIGGCHFPSN